MLARQPRHCGVDPNCGVQNDALPFPVLGHQADAGLYGVLRRPHLRFLAVEEDRPTFERVRTKNHASDLGSAGSDEAAKAKYPNGWKAPKPYLRIVPMPK